jgi:hypothetical protein
VARDGPTTAPLTYSRLSNAEDLREGFLGSGPADCLNDQLPIGQGAVSG